MNGSPGWKEETRATAPYLKYLLSVDPGDERVQGMDPMERRAGILDGLRALVLEESRRRPLVIVVEDLHWVDEKSNEALAALVDVVASAPVLLILTFRPGYSHSLGERTYYSRLALNHLPPEESAAMAERVLAGVPLPKQVHQLITSKGEGNPFYIEEVTKSLVESGVLRQTNGSYTLDRPIEEIRVPDTIQEVILSRIDRLEREAKEAIQLASVIGREFTVRLLDRISDIETKLDDLLSNLKTLELIYEKGYFPELSYMFKHALTHDVAYSTLLIERRRALHRLIGAAIEELYADRLAEQYEALAHHFSEGQDWEKALEYLEKAGDKAVAAFANQDALTISRGRSRSPSGSVAKPSQDAVDCAEAGAFVRFGMGDLIGAVGRLRQDERLRATISATGALKRWRLTHAGLMPFSWHTISRMARRFLREALKLAGDDGRSELPARTQLLVPQCCLISARGEWPLCHRGDGLVPEVQDPIRVAVWSS